MTKLTLGLSSVILLLGSWYCVRGEYAFAKSELALARKDKTVQRIELDEAARIDTLNPEIYYQRALGLMNGVSTSSRSKLREELGLAIADLQHATTLNSRSYLYQLALADAQDAVENHDAV